MCAAAMSFARIRRLYYGAPDPKGGAVDNGVRFFASPTCHHRPEVYGGISEAAAAALLRGFFEARRRLTRLRSGRILVGAVARPNWREAQPDLVGCRARDLDAMAELEEMRLGPSNISS